jgi:hypothetical protein
MSDNNSYEEQLKWCFDTPLDRSILNEDLVKLINAYWFKLNILIIVYF